MAIASGAAARRASLTPAARSATSSLSDDSRQTTNRIAQKRAMGSAIARNLGRFSAIRPSRVDSGRAWLTTRSKKRRERSEEHTSELQSLMRISYAVFCLKKKHRVNVHEQGTRESTSTNTRR